MFNSDFASKKNIIFLLLVIVLIFFVSSISEIAMLFFSSYVIACSLNPLVDRLSAKMNRCLASIVVLSGTFGVIFAFFIPVIFVAVRQIEALCEVLPGKVHIFQHFISHAQFY